MCPGFESLHRYLFSTNLEVIMNKVLLLNSFSLTFLVISQSVLTQDLKKDSKEIDQSIEYAYRGVGRIFSAVSAC